MRRDVRSLVCDSMNRIRRSVAREVTGSIARAVRTCSDSLRAIRARSAGESA